MNVKDFREEQNKEVSLFSSVITQNAKISKLREKNPQK